MKVARPRLNKPAAERGPDMRRWNQWIDRIARLCREEDGPTAVEYAVMLALIIVVCITAITTLGTNANQTFSNVALNTAVAS